MAGGRSPEGGGGGGAPAPYVAPMKRPPSRIKPVNPTIPKNKLSKAAIGLAVGTTISVGTKPEKKSSIPSDRSEAKRFALIKARNKGKSIPNFKPVAGVNSEGRTPEEQKTYDDYKTAVNNVRNK